MLNNSDSSMEDEDGVQKLFYELSSESRISILRELQANTLRMQQLARKLDMTDTEAFRQFQRLSDALLIRKDANGAYSITQYGRLVMQFSLSFDFASRFRDALLTRDVFSLPYQFIDRLGELSDSEFTMDTVENFNLAENAISMAEDYAWWLGIKPTDPLKAKLSEAANKGIKVKCIAHEDNIKQGDSLLSIRGLEVRTLKEIPAVILCTEKAAGVNLLSLDGRTDYALFHGRDSRTRKFADDLYTYYWYQGKPW